MNEDDKNKIIKRLTERGVNRPCPRCGNNDFSIIDGYFSQPLQPDVTSGKIGGPSIPSVVTACNKCGYLSQHALGALGLLPTPTGDGKP